MRTIVTPSHLRASPCLLADFQELPAPLLLSRPRELLVAHQPSEVATVLREAEAAARHGEWVGGMVTYEAAAAFNLPALPTPPGLPLAWFARFDRQEEVIFPATPPAPAPTLTLERTREAYTQQLRHILDAIQAGESYQVNLTLGAQLSPEIDPARLFLDVQPAHRHPYGLWLHTGETAIASFSPELFLEFQGDVVITAPIKGTRPRSRDPEQDAHLLAELRRSPKERAEHVMIVDMARNDLGRVCRTGSVGVEQLWEPRSFPAIHHLETRVRGVRPPGVTLDHLFAALFPAASITGAPKHRTMELIRALEQTPRGVYTGSLCLLRPGGDGWCSVAIRTVTQVPGEPCRLGLGGGIVADSDAEGEWAELHHKGAFLHHLPPRPGLLETMLVDGAGEVVQLARHLDRLERSARALGMPCPREALERAIREQAAGGSVRLALAADGGWAVTQRPLPAPREALRVRLAPGAVDRRERLLAHKSTRRELWEGWLARAVAAGYDDVVLFNGLGHVTEGVIRAIAVKRAGVWCIPPLRDGLLPSLWREETRVCLGAVEASITLEEFMQAEEVRMGNSVRGGARVVEVAGADGE